MTVSKLLSGKDGPLSIQEFNYWNAYFAAKAEIEKKANNPKKSGHADVQFKKMMGNNKEAMNQTEE